LSSFLWLSLLALLPLAPAWAAVLLALGGGWALWCSRQPRLVGPFLLLGLLGAAGQVFAPRFFLELPQPPPYLDTVHTGALPNLLPPFALNGMFGWNHHDHAGGFAQRVENGFWRLPRKNPVSGREQTEFLVDNLYSIEQGRTYTQSFYLRHDGQVARFRITFFTNTGHHPMPTQMEPVAPGVWRVWASYTAQEGDRRLRAIDFLNEGGDWTYVEVGWAKLEESPSPTAFTWGSTGQIDLWERVGWWAGVVLIGFLVFQLGTWLAPRLKPDWAAGAVLLGMGLHLGYTLWQLDSAPFEGFRPSGLTPQPNLLGHSAVVLAGLVWLLGGARWGAAALGVAGALIWVTGSRGAFWAWIVLLLVWWWGLGRRHWWVLGPLFLGFGLLIWQPEWFGRLGQATTLDFGAQSRLVIWQVAWKAFLEHPWGGVGFGNFPVYYLINRPVAALEHSTGHAHNLWLHLLAEGGVLALLGFLLWFLGLMGLMLRRRVWKGGALLLLSLVLGLFDYTFFFAGVYYPLLLAIGHTIAMSSKTSLAASSASGVKCPGELERTSGHSRTEKPVF